MSPSKTSTAQSTTTLAIDYRQPTVDDGTRLWEIASDSQVLDVNSSYSYVLWCHDFANTSIVAEVDGRAVGFVTGYRRQTDPSTIMVWQVAVDDAYRGHGIAATMLHRLLDRTQRLGVVAMHTTISPDNVASQRLFGSVASARGLRFERRDLFAVGDFPDAHEPEDLYMLEPELQEP
ncbi:diaminobutyrate acetyltransferase [Gordonia soli]|uniref:L-2,4-diaminobutyric acid acetyltransferase n=1 Tax=Gordonia soli NBRC 108243 TaxID=1223545 RepID=M0QL57_9ACTN|nr:diaminobutyrate acetyltransferase [Gordonia soli]GAC69026.1 L-2,4-diaminobutyric acid acetyltransferase [Gordonia soli NBRC 108243]